MNLTANDADDVELWARWQQGEQPAFETIVRRHAGRLLAVAARLLRDDIEADEVVQETFIAAWRAGSGFDGRSLLSTWLHRIAINAALARMRRKNRRSEIPMEQAFTRNGGDSEAEGSQAAYVDPPDRHATDEAERRDLARTVRDAIDTLDEEQRQVLVLRDIEELSSKEVAAALGISDVCVRQRLHRARQTVAERLRPELCGADAITCGGRLDLLLDHLDLVLAPEWTEAVPGHVRGCATCTALADGYAQTLADILRSASMPPIARSELTARSTLAALRSLAI